jgi:hypothetical protein
VPLVVIAGLQRRRARARRAQKLRHFDRRHRLAEQKALHLVAGVAAQEGLLLGVLDALGDHRHAKRLGHIDDSPRDRLVLGIARQVAYEGAVDLDDVDRKLL